jgi:hypothetical protein
LIGTGTIVFQNHTISGSHHDIKIVSNQESSSRIQRDVFDRHWINQDGNPSVIFNVELICSWGDNDNDAVVQSWGVVVVVVVVVAVIVIVVVVVIVVGLTNGSFEEQSTYGAPSSVCKTIVSPIATVGTKFVMVWWVVLFCPSRSALDDDDDEDEDDDVDVVVPVDDADSNTDGFVFVFVFVVVFVVVVDSVVVVVFFGP